MKLTFEHGRDSFAWDQKKQPAPGKTHRDIGIVFWLDGVPLNEVAKSNAAAETLREKIDYMLNTGWRKAAIRDYLKSRPQDLPAGIEL